MSLIERYFFHPVLYRIAKISCFLVFKIVWRMKVYGKENVPKKGAVIIAANHRSLADPPLVGVATTRYVHFLAKEELFRFRPFGWLIKNLNAHPLNRGGSDIAAFKIAKKILSEGEGLIVFPEGRRSKTDELGKPKAGVGMLAHISKAPVIPTYIHNSGHLKDFKRLIVSFGSPIRYENFDSYERMAEDVMASIADLKSRLALNNRY